MQENHIEENEEEKLVVSEERLREVIDMILEELHFLIDDKKAEELIGLSK